MHLDLLTLDGKKSGILDLSDAVFSLDPRKDILHRVVRWQLAKRRAGTHKVKGRSEISRTGAKMYKQKGTGRARHSSARVSQFRGGGKTHGPLVRDHSHDLPKKVRALALKHALSSKAASSNLVVIESLALEKAKTSYLASSLKNLGLLNALIIDGISLDQNFSRAAANIPNIHVLPVQGINVYDILRCKTLVLSKEALDVLEERFK